MIRTETRLGEIAAALRPNGSPSTLTSHARIFLILDRTLSPAGERRLKDLRCLGRGAEFPWPSPGVYNIPKLAQKICTALAQAGRLRKNPPLIRFEELLIELWLKEDRKVSLASFERELKASLRLAPLGLSAEEWASVIQEIESASKNSSGDLSLWGERIFLYLEAWQWAISRNCALSAWDAVYTITYLVSAEDLKSLSWISLLERHPFRCTQEDLSFVVPEIQAPQPLERNFLEKLSTLFPVDLVSGPYVHDDQNFFLNNIERARSEIFHFRGPNDAAIAWAFEAEAPGPIEALQCLPGNFPLDVTLKNLEDDNESLRILGLYVSHLQNPSDTQHPFHRFQKESRFLEHWGLSSNGETPSPAKIVDTWIEKTDPELSSTLLQSLKGISLGKLSQVFLLLSRSTLFRVECAELHHSRLSAKGVPLLTLPDLVLSGTENFCLWGSRKDFIKFLAPQSSPVLRNQEWPLQLRKILENKGLSLPDPQAEQELLLGSLQCLQAHLKVIEPPQKLRHKSSPAPQWLEPKLLARESISPSALETYAECSFRYYVERVLRPERIEDWDPVPLNPMEYGTWVHGVLENILQKEDWSRLDTQLRESIQLERDKAFLSPHSPAYAKILEQEGDVLFERLRDHLLHFEKPLLKIMGTREQLHAEMKIKGEFLGRVYNGKIDRLDIYKSGIKLLWDYKTGRIEGKALTQIRNNKFQWHLYRELLKEGALNSIPFATLGGGYLNPLDPNKSYLMIYDEASMKDRIQAFCELAQERGHKIEVLEADSEETVRSALGEKLQELGALMDQGVIRPHGDAQKHCTRCQFRSLCGKPYLEGDIDDVAN